MENILLTDAIRLATHLVARLKREQAHIAFAESCTGGLCAATLISVPGASEVIEGSIVTYSERVKSRFVGVSPADIATYGVVSEVVAREMAEGVAKVMEAEVGVGITGFAGPSSGDGLPVGCVCIGLCVRGVSSSRTYEFGDLDRQTIRGLAVKAAFTFLEETLNRQKA